MLILYRRQADKKFTVVNKHEKIPYYDAAGEVKQKENLL